MDYVTAPPSIDLTVESPPVSPSNNTPCVTHQNPRLGKCIKDEEVKVPKEVSTVWKSYTTTKGEDGVMIAQCKGCNNKYKCGGKKYGTSTILRHREKCPKLRFGDVGQMIIDHDGKEIKAFENQIVSNAGKSELDLYLEDPKLDFSYYEDLDVLTYWRDNRYRYPVLSLLACDVLAIPITIIASESAFSIGAHVITKYRSSTLSRNVQAQVCTCNWLHGYAHGNGEDAKVADVVNINDENAELIDEKQDNFEDFDDNMAEED